MDQLDPEGVRYPDVRDAREPVFTGNVDLEALERELAAGQVSLVGMQAFADGQHPFSLANLRAVLEAGGASMSRVLKTTVFLADMADFPGVNEVYARHFGDHRPARATVAVRTLPMSVLVEIDAIAGAEG